MSSEQVRPKKAEVGVPDNAARRPTTGVSLHELVAQGKGAPKAAAALCGWAHLRPVLPGHQI